MSSPLTNLEKTNFLWGIIADLYNDTAVIKGVHEIQQNHKITLILLIKNSTYCNIENAKAKTNIK